MGLLFPELLVLVIPAGLAWWATRGGPKPGMAVRGLVLLLVVFALSAPFLQRKSKGRDIIIVVDQSRSMPAGSSEQAAELIELVEDGRGAGDRVGIVLVGSKPVVERAPSAEARFNGFTRDVKADGSDLAGGIETALSLIPEGRGGRILLLSDGEATGREPAAAARRAAARDIPVHVRILERPAGDDVRVAQLDLPGRVDEHEPFQFTGWVHADAPVTAKYTLLRDGEVLSTGEKDFVPGANRLLFRDRLDHAHVAVYELRLEPEVRDRVPENDVGVGAVKVEGSRRVLLINEGEESPLSRGLRKGGIDLQVVSAENAPLTPVGLTGYRAVLVENVDANRLGFQGMDALNDYVITRGGGLLLTGGMASFGVGGYHESILDPLLPVTMELRQEHRKMAMAMSVVLDRSGSMSMTVGDGSTTKMDLANQGTAAAIRLLSPMDSISVIAVDTAPHVFIKQQPAEDKDALASQARIQSEGGGIYVRSGLQAAYNELKDAPQANRHVILFSDAADSEEQEGVPALLKKMEAENITVSVIALGTPGDPDADFLKQTAKQGSGEAYFTTNASELPRLFAMDTVVAARSAFVDVPSATRVEPGMVGIGTMAGSFPTVGGYNLTYLAPGATQGVVTTDENAAPLFAFHSVGTGRVAAYTGQIGGTYGAGVVRWSGFSRFFVTTTRWLAAQEEPTDWYTSVRREGGEAVVAVESVGGVAVPHELVANLLHPDGTPQQVVLSRVSETAFEARVPLDLQGVTLGTITMSEDGAEDRVLHLPPMALPYSPEFEAVAEGKGDKDLRQVARLSAGRVNAGVSELYEGESEAVGGRVITRELALLAVLLMLFEIAFRRLQLWGALDIKRAPRNDAVVEARSVQERARAQKRKVAAVKRAAVKPPTEDTPAENAKKPPPDDDDDEGGIGGALSAARKRGRRRLDR